MVVLCLSLVLALDAPAFTPCAQSRLLSFEKHVDKLERTAK